jgi:TAP-like protein
VEGEGHTACGQSTCVDKAVNEYLLNLTTPDEGLTCSR